MLKNSTLAARLWQDFLNPLYRVQAAPARMILKSSQRIPMVGIEVPNPIIF
jgi:hypothetical protein